MKSIEEKILLDILKPWEKLNDSLISNLVLNKNSNDFLTNASNLATAIKHFPESTLKFKPFDLSKENISYQIISDLSDSAKHGDLSNPKRQCDLILTSLVEKSTDLKYRFLRNQIEIGHATHGKRDFLECSRDAIFFILAKCRMASDWKAVIKTSNIEFSSNIELFADRSLQVSLQGWHCRFIQKNESGVYDVVGHEGKFNITLNHNWPTSKEKDD
ncbi:hypothetical protein [Pedobacter sp. R-06]|uniref:hypothetical protein n=1 Tax=Pedobacter sp. R-06 TaxID=3404051 RepID=UPI003CFB0FFE